MINDQLLSQARSENSDITSNVLPSSCKMVVIRVGIFS